MKRQQEQIRTTIGGQALIEGIYMRGPQKQSVVVRNSDGELVEKVENLRLIQDRHPVLGWPLIRGVVNFGASMVSGVKALMYSAEFFPDEENEPGRFEQWLSKRLSSEAMEKLLIYFAVILGICFSVGLFFLLPTFLVGFIRPAHDHYILRNLLEGCVKILLLLAYMILVSRMSDMKRVFSYHGAEHKTIRCYEMGLPLTVENVRAQPRKHPRCGTSFLFVVLFVSILVGSVIQSSNTFVRMLLHLALLPVVVAVSYEFNRLVGRHDNWLTRILTAPGLALQNFTTNEPDDSMIEVGIAAVKLVLPEKEGDDRW